jgi:hypothetical protein
MEVDHLVDLVADAYMDKEGHYNLSRHLSRLDYYTHERLMENMRNNPTKWDVANELASNAVAQMLNLPGVKVPLETITSTESDGMHPSSTMTRGRHVATHMWQKHTSRDACRETTSQHDLEVRRLCTHMYMYKHIQVSSPVPSFLLLPTLICPTT